MSNPFPETSEYVGGYRRVLPRDLFNEGSLLKCYGRLWILLSETHGHNAQIVEEDVDHFDIQQNEATGGLTVTNLTFTIDGVPYRLERSLNSREAWPLMVTERAGDPDFEEVEVFDDHGNFTEDMLGLIGVEPGDEDENSRKDNPNADLIARLENLARQREHEKGLSKADHPRALEVSVAGEHRVNRAIANMLPQIIEALAGK
tara:strand:- start:6608 stop:7216 length:609 start_codon:yes stop_codon:yes gene_type:complete